MSALNDTLKQLVASGCAHPPRSIERQQYIQDLYRRVMQSGKLWQENTPYYGDALQETWEYCCQHLDEYDPTRSTVTTWMNNRLQWTLKKWRDRQYREQERTANPTKAPDGNILNPIDTIASNTNIDQAERIWQNTLHWVQSDPDGVLQSTCFRKRKDINAQVLFLKRFPSETPWQEIASEFDLNAAESKDLPKFYNRNCLPLLRRFGISQGYLEAPKK